MARLLLALALLLGAVLVAVLAPGCSGPPAVCDQVVSSVSGAQAAVTSATAGTSVCLADGRYPLLSLSARKAAPGVLVQAQHPGKATIAGAKLAGSGLTVARFRIQGGGVEISPNAASMTVSHNLLAGGNYYGVFVCPAEPPDACTDISIIGNIFYGSFEEDQIRANVYHDSADRDPYGLLVEANQFVGNVEHGTHNDVFQSVWVGDHLYFRRNYLHDFGGQGLLIKDQAAAIDTIVVENNLIVRQNRPCEPSSLCAGYQLSPLQIFGPTRNVSIRRNTIWGAEGGVFALRGTGWQGPTAMTDNVIYSTYSDDTQFAQASYLATGNVRCTNQGFPSTGFTTDCTPPFVNPAGGDWRTRDGHGVDWRPADQWYGP